MPPLFLHLAPRKIGRMEQENKVRIDVVGSADGFKPAAQDATQELDRLKSTAQSAGQELGNMARGVLAETTAGMGELGVVAERAVLSAASLGAGFLAATVGLAAYAAAAREGRAEQLGMEHALIMTGNAAGLTREQMMQLSVAVEQSTTLTIKQSKNLVTELVSSGKIAGEAIGAIATLSDNYANATGAKVDSLGPKLVSLFEDPAKGASKLNETMHFLTNAQLDYIKTLVDTGREGEAQLELANRLNEVLPKHAQELGALETVWVNVRKAASGAWDAMLAVGREDTLDEKLSKAKEGAQDAWEWYRKLRDFDGKVAVYQAAVDKQNADAAAAKQAAEDQAREARANALIAKLTKSGQKNAIAEKMRDSAALLPAGAELDEILAGYRDQIIKIDAVKKPKEKKPDDTEFKERLRQLRDEAKAEADLINQRQKANALLASYERQDALMVQRIDRSAQLASMSERERVVSEAVYAAQDKSAQRQEQIIKQISDETERTRALNEEKQQLASHIDAVTAAAEKSYDAQRGFESGWNRALQNYVDDVGNSAKSAQGMFNNMADGMSDALARFAQTGRISFSGLANSIIADILRMQARASTSGLMGYLTNALGAYFGGAGSGFGQTPAQASVGADINSAGLGAFEKGGVFANSPSLSSYSGGVYSTPQLFAFANGAGVFGEAGPEAIMPLKRGKDGKLGVASESSGGVTVNVYNNGNDQARTEKRSDGKGGSVIDVFIEQVKGSLASDISRGSGVVPAAMQQAYGVSRKAGAY